MIFEVLYRVEINRETLWRGEVMFNPVNFFKYLRELQRQKVPTKKNMDNYEKLLWLSEFNLDQHCQLINHNVRTEQLDANWLIIRKPELPLMPKIPNFLKEWLSNFDQLNHALPERHEWLERKDDKGEVYREQFSASIDRLAFWQELLEEWRQWQKICKQRERVYNQFFTWFQQMKREGEDYELLWGHGIFTWKHESGDIKRPFFVTPIEIDFNSNEGIFKIAPNRSRMRMEMEYLPLDVANREACFLLENEVQNKDIDVWESKALEDYGRRLINLIHEQGQVKYSQEYSKNEIESTLYPTIWNSSVILLRKRDPRLMEEELTKIIGQVEVDGVNALAAPMQTIFDVSAGTKRPPMFSHQKEILFPLPSNEEQRDVVRRLNDNSGVVVQGPPGTGKSHTIINLIAHLLANGKRVLVTSHKEPALKIIETKIRKQFPEIAPLCVFSIGGDRTSVQSLERAVEEIEIGLNTRNVSDLEKRIKELRERLERCQQNQVGIKTRLSELSKKEFDFKMIIHGRSHESFEIAQYLADNREKYGWFPDDIFYNTQIPLNDLELQELYQLLSEYREEDVVELRKTRPSLEDLLPSDLLKAKFDERNSLLKNQAEREKILSYWETTLDPELAKKRYKMVQEIYIKREQFGEPWQEELLKVIARNKQDAREWTLSSMQMKNELREVKKRSGQLRSSQVRYIQEEEDKSLLKENLLIVREELVKSGKLGFFFKNWKAKEMCGALELCTINNNYPQKPYDIELVVADIEREEFKRKLTILWNNLIEPLGGPMLEESDKEYEVKLDDYLEKVRVVLEWYEDAFEKMENLFEVFRPKKNTELYSKEIFIELLKALEFYTEQAKDKELNSWKNRTAASLYEGIVSENAHPIWERLYEGFTTENIELWNKSTQALKELTDRKSKLIRLIQFRNSLYEVVPRWTEQISKDVEQGILHPPVDWKRAWEWKGINSWFNEHFGESKIEAEALKLKELKAEEMRLIKQLVDDCAWKEQLLRTTIEQRSSLRSWADAMRRIGKGTGRHAERHFKNAEREMLACQEVVPVWIMPMSRTLQTMNEIEHRFDVVIVDESSQCDVFSTILLNKGERVIVVGDDKQISPDSTFFDEDKEYELIEAYLDGMPKKERYSLKDSLYDIARRIYPEQQLMLREHFRSVPEIIQFSNDLCYNGDILPLRFPLSTKRLEPPIQTVYVGNGARGESSTAINEPEADAIVKYISDLIKDPEYKEKTFGVISLQGKEQALLIEEKLLQVIGEREFTQRELVCGDAYALQGDERDVIFLSMVAAPNRAIGALTREADIRRFNVATSRAKDQMWLFYSTKLEELNPKCVRYQLLNYCLNPVRGYSVTERSEEIFLKHGSSKFLQELCKEIKEKGYHVMPEYQVGKYRIDLVVEGINDRLAIECDGDEVQDPEFWENNIEKQTVLERAGWEFVRIRRSLFHYRKDEVLNSLWNKLISMEIEPKIQIRK